MNGCKIFLGGLNYNTTEDSLLKELEKHGKVLSIRIVTDFETGRSKGFGFATYSTGEEAQKAIDSLNNELFEGKRIGVKQAIEKKR
jgi:RNA recognition motif-containing protein